MGNALEKTGSAGLWALATGLTLGFWDLFFALLLDRYPYGEPTWSEFEVPAFTSVLPIVLATAACSLVAYSLSWRYLLSRFARESLKKGPALMSLAGFFAICLSLSLLNSQLIGLLLLTGLLGLAWLILLGSLTSGYQKNPKISLSLLAAGPFLVSAWTVGWSDSAALLLQLILIVSWGIAGSIGIYALAWRIPAEKLEHFASALPWLLAQSLVLLWLLKFHSPAGWLPSLAAVVVFLLSGGLTWWATGRSQTMLGSVLLLSFLTLLGFTISADWQETSRLKSEPSSIHSLRRIVLITIDTLRADSLGCYQPGALSPQIDALAKESLLFRNAYSPAPWTLPALSSILSGLPPTVHGATSFASRLPDEVRTLAEELEGYGYATAAIVSNPFLNRFYKLDQGFDHYRFYYPEGTAPRQQTLGSTALQLGQSITALSPPGYIREASTRELTDETIEWLRENQDQDFFLWLHYFDPHNPYNPPAEFFPDGPVPENDLQLRELSAFRSGRVLPTPSERAWVQQLYAAEVRYVDTSVGRVVDTLMSLGLFDDTLIVLTSDHGEEFWEHNGVLHGHSLYEEVIRVPLLVKLPSETESESGEILDAVSIERIPATILELAGFNPRNMAASLTPIWEQGQAAQEPIYATGLVHFDDRESLTVDGVKFIRSRITGREELYDLNQDAGELRSLRWEADTVASKTIALLNQLEAEWAALRGILGIASAPQGTLSPEMIQRLKSLGYIQ